ncbi:MAG: hypothetical protein I3273_06225 [Candidatus Moeniiplasma glomeromycotorum]|nr:hypothetical protein [Candidatus Moeniiplasma glomeromycotorum]MCE8168013.1 hypothetical protein [Candidatus Moeniiplasma glomeromycotorum]MCE8169681.1 hypothetical protein [Candidatus Moeniiplasma glomeromycotorum]
MAGIDGKVKQLSDNILTLKDIRTRSALWFKPTDVSPATGVSTYIDLRIYPEWPYWTREYNFLPLPKYYQEIRNKAVKDLLSKKPATKSNGEPWKENGRRKELTEEQNTDKYPQVNYFLVKTTNDTIEIIFQNWKGYTLNRPNLALFWGENDGSGKGDKIPNLYWVDNVQLIDPGKNFVQVKATLDLVWRDWGRFCESWGTAVVKKSTMGFYHNKHEDDKPSIGGGEWEEGSGMLDGRYELDNKEARWDNANPEGVMACFACLACFDFCSNLENNRSCPGGYTQPKKATWQPKFKLAFVHPKNNINFFGSKETRHRSTAIIEDEETGEEIVEVPTNYTIQPWKGGTKSLVDIFFQTTEKKPFLLFLMDKEHELEANEVDFLKGEMRTVAEKITKRIKEEIGTSLGSTSGRGLWKISKNFHYSTLPKLYNDQPHMLNHSSVMINFMKEAHKFDANLRHVMVRKIAGKLRMIYQVFRKSSLSGITYTFLSGTMFFRWNINVTGEIQNTANLLDDLLDKVFDTFGSTFGLDKLAEQGKEEGKGFFSGIKMLCVLLKEAIKGWIKKQIGTDLHNVLTGHKYAKLLGVKGDKSVPHSNETKTEQGKQADLKAKSTKSNKDKTVETDSNHPDSVHYNLNFWTFSNKITGKPFEITYKQSNNLYDNLTNNNNLAPKQDIYCKFSAFKQLMKAGEFQGTVNLRYDNNGWFSGITKKGTHFVETYEKYEKADVEEKKIAFPPFRYKGTTLQSFSFPPTSPTGNRQGIEKIIPGEDINKKGPKNEGGDDVSIDTTALYIDKASYCRGPDGDIMNVLMQALLSAGYQKQPESSSYWYFKENSNDSVEVAVTEGKYDYKMIGYNKHGLDDAKGVEANYFIVEIRGSEKTGFVSIQAGLRKKSDPKLDYVKERDDKEKEDQIVIDDYNQPEALDLGTEIDTEIDLDLDDDRDDADLDDLDVDPDADEKENEDEMDTDYDLDKDKDDDKDDDVDDDIDADFDDDLDDDTDFDFDKDKDKDKDDDDDIDHDADHSDKDDDKDRDRG